MPVSASQVLKLALRRFTPLTKSEYFIIAPEVLCYRNNSPHLANAIMPGNLVNPSKPDAVVFLTKLPEDWREGLKYLISFEGAYFIDCANSDDDVLLKTVYEDPEGAKALTFLKNVPLFFEKDTRHIQEAAKAIPFDWERLLKDMSDRGYNVTSGAFNYKANPDVFINYLNDLIVCLD